MTTRRNLLLLVCLLGLSSFVFAGMELSMEYVDENDNINSNGRLLGGHNYACTMILYTKENIQSNGGLLAVLNIFGPLYTGAINDLRIQGANPTYFHNLHRIVYGGAHCDCTVTLHQSTGNNGKTKDYYSKTIVSNSDQTKIDVDFCWANKAESLSITCRV